MTGPIIITGMHRSGTSLLASMLRGAGVDVGKRLVSPGPGNPRGYFEDVDFVGFHEDLLAALGASIYAPCPPMVRVPDEFRRRARALIDARAGNGAWGWKDPRSTLFLDFWAQIAPEAWFVFVYRQPASVVDSLRRRRDRALHRHHPGAALLERLGLPRFRLRTALALWSAYNQRIVDFVQRHDERAVLVSQADLVETVPLMIERMRAAGVPLCPIDAASYVDPMLGSSSVPPRLERRCARNKGASALMTDLDAAAAEYRRA